jgi:hypothetical protein
LSLGWADHDIPDRATSSIALRSWIHPRRRVLHRFGHRCCAVRESPSFVWSNRKAAADIRGRILRRRLPTDPELRRLAFSWAEYETTTGRAALRWHPPLAVGIVLALCGLYAFPVISALVVAVQALLVLCRTVLYVADVRRIRNSVDLLRDGKFDAPGITADS